MRDQLLCNSIGGPRVIANRQDRARHAPQDAFGDAPKQAGAQRAPRPCVPMTTRSAFRALAASTTIVATGRPTNTSVDHGEAGGDALRTASSRLFARPSTISARSASKIDVHALGVRRQETRVVDDMDDIDKVSSQCHVDGVLQRNLGTRTEVRRDQICV